MTSKPMFSKQVKKQTLAEQVAIAIKESILSAEWKGGEALPTEPELASEFGVSRAVIRDATRMLVAQGLVDAQHGRGVFVTHSQTEAFSESLLLALRRAGATVWDVEHFEQILYPEVFALATSAATEEDLAHIQQAMEAYLETYRDYIMTITSSPEEGQPVGVEQLSHAYRLFIQSIFTASHNQVLILLAEPLLKLRNVRFWYDSSESEKPTEASTVQHEDIEVALARESIFFHQIVAAISSRDADHARATAVQLMQLPPEAIHIMRQTPVGEVPQIPLPPPTP
jgi:GntR family transcriptional repressor for pyruvate dehydrogenase complex